MDCGREASNPGASAWTKYFPAARLANRPAPSGPTAMIRRSPSWDVTATVALGIAALVGSLTRTERSAACAAARTPKRIVNGKAAAALDFPRIALLGI